MTPDGFTLGCPTSGQRPTPRSSTSFMPDGSVPDGPTDVRCWSGAVGRSSPFPVSEREENARSGQSQAVASTASRSDVPSWRSSSPPVLLNLRSKRVHLPATEVTRLSQVLIEMSMSLDGFVAGLHDSDVDRLHEWMFEDERGSEVLAESLRAVGSAIAGRRTYDLSVRSWG